jgi:hypothetical protein
MTCLTWGIPSFGSEIRLSPKFMLCHDDILPPKILFFFGLAPFSDQHDLNSFYRDSQRVTARVCSFTTPPRLHLPVDMVCNIPCCKKTRHGSLGPVNLDIASPQLSHMRTIVLEYAHQHDCPNKITQFCRCLYTSTMVRIYG